MKLALLMPTTARFRLNPPHRFLQHGLRTALMSRVPYFTDHELVLIVADDPDSTVDWDAELARARKACEGTGPGVDMSVIYFKASRNHVGVKRNELTRRADADVCMHWDDDDYRAPQHTLFTLNFLQENPSCLGNFGSSNYITYDILTRSYVQRQTSGGGSFHVYRREIWDEYQLAYSEQEGVGIDTAFSEALRKSHSGPFSKMKIRGYGSHMIVIRMPTGHTAYGQIKRQEVVGDPDGLWLLSSVVPQLYDHYRGLLAEFNPKRWRYDAAYVDQILQERSAAGLPAPQGSFIGKKGVKT